MSRFISTLVSLLALAGCGTPPLPPAAPQAAGPTVHLVSDPALDRAEPDKTITIAQPTGVNVPLPALPSESKRSVVPAVELGVLAAGGIGTGIGLRVLSASIKSQAVALGSAITAVPGSCVPQWLSYDKRCPTLQNELKTENTYYNVATGTLIAGGAAAAGMVLYLALPSPQPKTAVTSAAHGVRLVPILGPTTGGLLVSGAF